jgi:hypothetical protein
LEEAFMAGVRRLKSIEVRVIPPEKYPQFQRDREHLFMHMEGAARTKEVVDIFAQVHAQQALGRRSATRQERKAG